MPSSSRFGVRICDLPTGLSQVTLHQARLASIGIPQLSAGFSDNDEQGGYQQEDQKYEIEKRIAAVEGEGDGVGPQQAQKQNRPTKGCQKGDAVDQPFFFIRRYNSRFAPIRK